MRKKTASKDTKKEAAPVKAPVPQKKAQVAKKTKEAAHTLQRVVGLHNLELPRGAHKRRKLLGRGPGSGHGKTSTRGSKGQTSRAGRDFYPGFEGGQTPLIRRIPKRGFTSRSRKEYQIINLEHLKSIKDTHITLELLLKKGLIKNLHSPVKILGDGELKESKTVQAHAFSKSAAEKIRQLGGAIEVINA